ncbi:MAG: PAS domain S-box protein [Bacteroidota bacterium]|nr:PAS domain S-box protein [Bacteroidota bacterium]MDP4197553.1 PAS domain S-box protein [Bacteroidota bacterium]
MKIKNSILFKIVFILTVSVVVTLGLLGYFNYQMEKSRLIEQSENTLKIRLNRLSFILREPLWTYNLPEIKRILSYELKSDETIALALRQENKEFLIGARNIDGVVHWDYTEPSSSGLFKNNSDVKKVETEIKHPSRIGYFEYFYSYKKINNELLELVVKLIFQTFIVSLILVLAIYFSLKKIIVFPIRQLNQAMGEMSDQNYSSRLETKLKDEVGHLVHSFNKMIDRLKAQREALLFSEIKYHSVFDYANDAILLLKDSRVIDCNKRASIMFQKSKSEIIGCFPTEIVNQIGDPKELRIVAENYINLALKGETQFFEWDYYNKEGEIINVEIALSKIEFNDSIYLQTLVRDITEKKEAERKILESQERYRNLVENAPEIIFSLSHKENLFSSLNPAFEKLTGWKKEDWLGKYFGPLVHPDDINIALENVKIISSGITPSSFELRIMDKSGKYMTYEITATPNIEAGKVFGALGIGRNIEERKESERNIQASLKEKEILLKEIHHRVKNNLQIISSLLNLQSGYVKDKSALEMFKNSQNRIKSMALIHERLYKSDNLAEINFCDYARSLTTSLFHSYQVSTNCIDLKLEIEDNLFLGVDTAIPCGLIINELVTNAIKHAFPDSTLGGQILVSFMACGDSEYKMKISNNGTTFPKDAFENPQTLGLQLVKILTDQLKGKLVLNFSGITEFIIIFPLRKN